VTTEPDAVALATLKVQVEHLVADVKRIEEEYVKLARYIAVEKSVFGLITMVAVALVGIAVVKLWGAG
jgi:3D (Asp-Asp-Asp) domain-containing protein